MRYLTLITFIFLFSCKNETPDTTTEDANSLPKQDTEIINDTAVNQTDKLIDYNGDGLTDEAIVKLTKEGQGNPIENGIPSEYSIIFNGKLPEIPIGCCDATIINEGDLDNDGSDELSVVQSPMNGCVHTITTYSFKKGEWKKIFEPFLIPTGCDDISSEDLEKRVFTENGKIYFMETDMNDEDMRLIRKEAK